MEIKSYKWEILWNNQGIAEKKLKYLQKIMIFRIKKIIIHFPAYIKVVKKYKQAKSAF